MDRRSMWVGIWLIIMGGFLLAAQFDIVTIGWSTLWPLVIIIPGLILEGSFFLHRETPGVLVPGGILTITGLNLFICNTFGWWLMEYLWPLFPLAVAFGLFQLYVFDGRDRTLLIPVAILGTVAVVAFLGKFAVMAISKIIPLLLIGFGLYLLLRGRRRDHTY